MKTVDKAAFTLVELMVVIGLMAMLGTISVTGYFAAVRGMSDRAALDDTRSLIRLAMQTCLIDQTPTAVLFYNRHTQVKTDSVSEEEVGATSSGSAVAIKMAGRISYIVNGVLIDEFADWNQSYPSAKAGATSKSGVRFYRMTDLNKIAGGNLDNYSSLVNDYVTKTSAYLRNEYMVAAGRQVRDFCSSSMYDLPDNEYRWGRGVSDDNSGLKIADWQIGDAYGVEIASLDLPKGYIFGSQEPTSMKVKPVNSLWFTPDARDAMDHNAYMLRLQQGVTISAWRASRFKSIGTLSQTDIEDED